MGLIRVTAPANAPVSLAQAKAHVRATDFTDDDTLIGLFIEAATDHVDGPEGFLGRALIDQTWDYYLDAFPAGPAGSARAAPNRAASAPAASASIIKLPLPPLIEVEGVFWTDGAGAEQTLDPASYLVDTAGSAGRIALLTPGAWPTARAVANAVRIRFRAGYIDASDSPVADAVPGAIRAAILLIVGDLYANRENVVVGATVATLPGPVENLLRRYRFDLALA